MIHGNTRHATGLVLVILLAALIAGCGGEKDDAAVRNNGETEAVAEALTEAEETLVAKAAAVAMAIEKAPATAEAVLKENGITPDEYEAMVYEIAGSPKLSKAFEKAKAGL